MTDHADKSIEERVSKFITLTCQLLPKLCDPTSDHMHNLGISFTPSDKRYSILTGSLAEFYIRPIHTCIDDIDSMHCYADQLVCIGDFPVLPSEMTGLADTIECYKIEPYEGYPGFIRLLCLGEINYNWKHKRFEFKQTALTDVYVKTSIDNPSITNFDEVLGEFPFKSPTSVSGPAIKAKPTSHISHVYLAYDTVGSVFCPQWPREAQNWPARSRYQGWPTIDTISKVVQNGCHVVYAQHRSCRDDSLQWRLSFSVAEVILLHSWTKTQQIIFHLLRFFSKRELIQEDCPKVDEVLCTYHLKTLMLWTCEEKPPEWWDSSTVISICCELLNILSEWLKRRHCPNYFIPEANLFHQPLTSNRLLHVRRRLNEFKNSGVLSNWFMPNYILLIKHTQLKEFMARNVKPKFFVDNVELFLQISNELETKFLDILFCLRFLKSCYLCRCFLKLGLSSGLHRTLKLEHRTTLNSKLHSTMTYFPVTNKNLCFTHYANLLYMLNIAYGLRYGEISLDGTLFVEFVKAISTQPQIIRSQYHNFPKTYSFQSGRFQFLRAQDLMRNLIGSNCNSPSEFQLLSVLSEEFLRKALAYDDCRANGMASAAVAYLAALHFDRSQYREAISSCLAVVADQSPEKDKETLNAGCLLFIDDVARIVGLCVLHKKITENNLHYIAKRLYLDLRLSTKVFAHYLAVFSAERMPTCFDLQHNLTDSLFPMDKYLKASREPTYIAAIELYYNFNVNRQIVYRRIDFLLDSRAPSVYPVTINDTVINALVEFALENMTSFYRVIHLDFGIQCNTADCYRALYLYKCHKYDEVLHLCQRILHEPDLRSDLKEFSLTNVLLLPPIASFFDRDVQSLLGFHTLFYFLSPHNEDKRSFEETYVLTFEQWFSNNVSARLGLSAVLVQSYAIKCHYFLGRHFLVRYLIVRCCIDCKLPYTEALREFSAQKTHLPFEYIIRLFLQQKVRTTKIFESLLSCEKCCGDVGCC